MKKDNKVAVALEKKVAPWLELVKKLEELSYEICFGLVELVNEFGRNPVYEIIIRVIPRFTDEKLDHLFDCGARKFHAQLLLDASEGGTMLRRLPYRVGERYLTEQIPLVVQEASGDYAADMKYVSYKTLTRPQRLQVEPEGRSEELKNRDQQIAYLQSKEGKNARPPEVTPTMPFFVSGPEEVTLRRYVKLKREQIRPLAERMLRALDSAAAA